MTPLTLTPAEPNLNQEKKKKKRRKIKECGGWRGRGRHTDILFVKVAIILIALEIKFLF